MSETVLEDDPEFLLKQAKRCRTVAAGTLDERMRQALLVMARDYEAEADAIKLKQKPGKKPGT